MFSKKQLLVIFALLGWIFDFFDLILYSFLLTPIEREFGISDTEAALVYSFSLAFTAVGGILLGYVGDRIGRKPTLIISIALFSLGTLLSGLAWNLVSLVVFRILTAFGIGGEWAAGHTLINETLPQGSKAKASAVIQSGAPIGVALASLVGGYITPLIGWRESFFLAALPSFTLVLLMWRFLEESPKFLIFKEESKDRGSPDDIPRGVDYIRLSTDRSWKQLWQVRWMLLVGTLLSLWGMMAYWIIFSWTPKILVDLGYSDQNIARWMIMSQVGAFIGYIAFGLISDTTRRFKLTFTSFAAVFTIGVLSFVKGLSAGNSGVIYAGIFVTGLGTGFFSGYGPLYSALYPVKVRNTCASWCFNIGRMGAFVAPLMVVELEQNFGVATALSSSAIFSIILCFWVLLIPSKVQHMISATRVSTKVSAVPRLA